MDIPLDVQEKIDALMAEYEATPKTSIWMGHRSPNRYIDSNKGTALLAEVNALKSPYRSKDDKKSRPWWDGESSESKAKRVAIVVQRALKQEKEGRL